MLVHLVLLVNLLLVFGVFLAEAEFVFKHHNSEELVQILGKIHAKCPNVTKVYSLDRPSVRGIPLAVIEFSDKPGHHELCKYWYFKLKI